MYDFKRCVCDTCHLIKLFVFVVIPWSILVLLYCWAHPLSNMYSICTPVYYLFTQLWVAMDLFAFCQPLNTRISSIYFPTIFPPPLFPGLHA